MMELALLLTYSKHQMGPLMLLLLCCYFWCGLEGPGCYGKDSGFSPASPLRALPSQDGVAPPEYDLWFCVSVCIMCVCVFD